MVDCNGSKRDLLYELIDYLEEKQIESGFGDWLKNEDEMFYEVCIKEVEEFMERFEDD